MYRLYTLGKAAGWAVVLPISPLARLLDSAAHGCVHVCACTNMRFQGLSVCKWQADGNSTGPPGMYPDGYCYKEQPLWSQYRESSFGHGTLDILNSTHALWCAQLPLHTHA